MPISADIKGSPTVVPAEVIRATEEEKMFQIKTLETLHNGNAHEVEERLNIIRAATSNK